MRLPWMKQVGFILNWSVVGLCLGLIVIQFVPVNRMNPPVEGDVHAPAGVLSVLRRACYDCHSNETVWPWYSRVAPMSWVVARDVREGRAALNFSTWNQLAAEKQSEAIKESWEEVADGKMPTSLYLVLHPKARLSAADRSLLQGWSASAGRDQELQRHDP